MDTAPSARDVLCIKRAHMGVLAFTNTLSCVELESIRPLNNSRNRKKRVKGVTKRQKYQPKLPNLNRFPLRLI